MKKNIIGSILAFSVIYFAFALSIPAVNADDVDQRDGLVNCSTIMGKDNDGSTKILNPCTVCDLFVLIQRILNFLWWGISVPLTALMLAWGGFLMIVPGVGGEKTAGSMTKGKKIISSALIGLTISFFAWLMVDTVIKALSGQGIASGSPAEIIQTKGFGPWNEIKCSSSAPQTFQTPAPLFDKSGAVSTQAANALCSTCSKVTVPIKQGACGGTSGCLIDSPLNSRLGSLNQAFTGWEITEAWPPTVTHQNKCHYNGTCVDVALRGNLAGNPTKITEFIQKSGEQKLNAVYEVKTSTRREELMRQGVPAGNIMVVPQINAEHFSVYKL